MKLLSQRAPVVALCCLVFLASAGLAAAGTLHGTVTNGTTGKPAAAVQLILLQLQGGMQPVANAKSDSQGQFTIDNAGIGAQPMLLRAVYNDINFHQPVPPGTTQVDITVYEPTKDAGAIAIVSRIVVFQPNGSTLTVGEEYSVQNNSQPPKAYFLPAGNFDFQLPADAKLQQVAAAGAAGMPVMQAPIEKNRGRYAIAYAFRPGQSTVRLSYELPYPANAANVQVTSPYAAARLLVVAPPSVQITGAGLQPSGQEQGMNIYSRETLAANTTLTVNVSGTAPPPSDASAGNAQSGDNAGSANIQVIPGRLDALKWPMMGGFALLFLLGAYWLSRKQVVTVPVAVGASGAASVSTAAPVTPPVAGPPQATAVQANVSPGLKETDAQVGTSLDALKERLFRLELRRQAGTISEQEYTQERARAEQVLRDLLRG
jgi:hypothetical protein